MSELSDLLLLELEELGVVLRVPRAAFVGRAGLVLFCARGRWLRARRGRPVREIVLIIGLVARGH